MKFITKWSFVRLLVFAIAFYLFGLVIMTQMPGENYEGSFLPLTKQEHIMKELLQKDVEMLAGTIGQRNVIRMDALYAAADYIENIFSNASLTVKRQEFLIGKQPFYNIIGEKKGAENPDEIVVIGAHYDTVPDSPGANDNASGVAGLLALARNLAKKQPARTIRFVGFVNEEPPFFQTEQMGSLVYAMQFNTLNV